MADRPVIDGQQVEARGVEVLPEVMVRARELFREWEEFNGLTQMPLYEPIDVDGLLHRLVSLVNESNPKIG